MNRKRMVLAALLGILALCLIYAYLATPRLEKAPPRSASPRARQAQALDNLSKDQQSRFSQERIDFAFLEADIKDFPGAARDVFRFGQRRPPVVAAVKRPQVQQPVIVAPPPPVVEMVPIEVVQKALSQFTFLGFLDKEGEKTVFLSSQGSLFLAKQGEKFGTDLEFTVVDISGDLLQVRHSGREGLIEIPLIEQQKLSASVSAPARLAPSAPISLPRAKSFNRRILRPETPQESETDFPETIEENNPVIDENNPLTDENNPLTDENNPVIEENNPVIEENNPVIEENNPLTDENNPVIEENYPEGASEDDLPVEGDDVEGETNGSNQ